MTRLDTTSKDYGGGYYIDPPPDKYRVPVPREWMVCRYDFIYAMFKVSSVAPPEGTDITLNEMPWWMIEHPFRLTAYFLFENDCDAMVFKLTYL